MANAAPLVDRNSPCPCGSGKKFKRCHLGKEWELEGYQKGAKEGLAQTLESLKEVSYGRSSEYKASLDLSKLIGVTRTIKFVDLDQYLRAQGGAPFSGEDGLHRTGGLVINPWKTALVDPKNVYVAISEDITESALIHELAHVLDYLGGAKVMPWTAYQLSMELEVPIEHLEHLHEFGKWLDWLASRFNVELDADDTIIQYLYQRGLLIKAGDLILQNKEAIKAQSKEILKHLSENSQEIARLIRARKGYRGVRHGDLEA